MKAILKLMFIVTLIVHNQYFVNGQLFCDYSLGNNRYTGVYVEDMMENFSNAMEDDNKHIWRNN